MESVSLSSAPPHGSLVPSTHLKHIDGIVEAMVLACHHMMADVVKVIIVTHAKT